MSLKPIEIGDLLKIKFELFDDLLNVPAHKYCIYIAGSEKKDKIYTFFLQGTKEEPGFIDRFLVLETKENMMVVYSLLFKGTFYVPQRIFEYFVPSV